MRLVVGAIAAALFTLSGGMMLSIHSIAGDSVAEAFYHAVGFFSFGMAAVCALIGRLAEDALDRQTVAYPVAYQGAITTPTAAPSPRREPSSEERWTLAQAAKSDGPIRNHPCWCKLVAGAHDALDHPGGA